ncbi:MAG: serine hydrolase [Eubacteriales bacterium]|nr:serine hydrolase [Eubacteriales bacterium]
MKKSGWFNRKNKTSFLAAAVMVSLLISLCVLTACKPAISSEITAPGQTSSDKAAPARTTEPAASPTPQPPRSRPALIGTSPLTAVIGQPVSLLAGVHASDTVDGSLNDQINISGIVDWLTPGTYELNYSVSNSAGLRQDAVRTVTVQDPYADLRAANQIEASPDPDIQRLLALTLDQLGSLTGQIGLVFEELDSGRYFTINDQRQFRSASTAKLFVVMALYEEIAAGRLAIDQTMTYTQADYEGGSGILQEMDLSQSYSLGTLADYAIRYSDNIAFHMIIRIVGRDRVYDYYESVIGHPTNRSHTEMSAADAGRLLRHLYQSDNPWFAHMLDVMRETVYEQAIPGLLPPGTVSNKIGFYAEYFHDAAIVHDPRGAYILTIFTRDILVGSGREPAELLAELSLMINRQR